MCQAFGDLGDSLDNPIHRFQYGLAAYYFAEHVIAECEKLGRLPDGTTGLTRLVQALRREPDERTQAECDDLLTRITGVSVHRTRRERELAYLKRLYTRDEKLRLEGTAQYIELGGTAQLALKPPPAQRKPSVIRQQFDWQPISHAGELAARSEPLEDATAKITEVRKAVVLGEPGAGKPPA